MPDEDLDPELLTRPYAGMTAWKAISMPLKIVAGLCLAGMISILLFSPQWLKSRHRETSSAIVRPADLSLSHDQFQAKSRTIQGVLANSSGTLYKDVTITYTVRGPHGSAMGAVEATLDRVRPHEQAYFETKQLPAEALSFDLSGITGNPQ